MTRVQLLIACTAIIASANQCVGDNVKQIDVRYGPYHRNVLDVFPANAETPSPVLIYFHGGGWLQGDKRSFKADPITRLGITVVSANYRFTAGSPDAAPYPAPMNDGARVVQFVRSKASEWNIDPSRIALSGSSAGAVIAMWIGYRDEMAVPDATDPVLRFSTRVNCVLPIAGPTNLDPKWVVANVGGPPSIHRAALPFFGAESIAQLSTPKWKPVVNEASPINHVSADDPPTYAIYGSVIGNTPLPSTVNENVSIHHACFGQALQRRCEEEGVTCVLRYKGDQDKMSKEDFLRRYLVSNSSD